MVAWSTTLGALQRNLYITAEGGFAALSESNFAGWTGVASPWPGTLRCIPGVRAQGMKNWRHATGPELTEWMRLQVNTWFSGLNAPLVALGSVYNGVEVPMLRVTRERAVLTTTALQGCDSPGQRLAKLLRTEPGLLALCALPRG